MVAQLRAGELVILIDRYETNEPVLGAKLDAKDPAGFATKSEPAADIVELRTYKDTATFERKAVVSPKATARAGMRGRGNSPGSVPNTAAPSSITIRRGKT